MGLDTTIFENLATEIVALKDVMVDHKTDMATLDMAMLRQVVKELLAEATPQPQSQPSKGLAMVPAAYKGYSGQELWMASLLLEQAKADGRGKGPSGELQAAIKALTSTGSGTGDELVPTGMASEIWDDIHLEAKIMNLFGSPIPMPNNPFEFPAGLGDVTFYKGSENTATTATDTATKKMTLTGYELVGEVDWSYTLTEAAVLAVMPEVRRVITRNAREYMDKAILNADDTNAGTGNINLDDADPADTLYYLLGFNGLRHAWLVDATGQGVNIGAAMTAAKYQLILAKLGKYYAESPSRCAWIMDVSTYLKSLGIDEFLTVDKLGSDRATLLTGQLGSVYGAPVIVSEGAPLTEADGKVSTTAESNTKGQITLVHRGSWKVGFLRQLLIEVDRDIQKRQYILVASYIIALAPYGTIANETHTAGGYNITV